MERVALKEFSDGEKDGKLLNVLQVFQKILCDNGENGATGDASGISAFLGHNLRFFPKAKFTSQKEGSQNPTSIGVSMVALLENTEFRSENLSRLCCLHDMKLGVLSYSE